MNTSPIIFENVFRDLAVRHRGTAHPDPPLLMWKDSLDDDKHPLPIMVHRHQDFHALNIVEHGRGTHVIEGVSYNVARGDVYFMGPDTAHYFTRSHDLIVQGLYFTLALFDSPTQEALAELPGISSLIPGLMGTERAISRAGRWLHLTSTAYAQVAGQVAKMNAEWDARQLGGALMLRGLFTCLLIDLTRFQAAVHPRPTEITSGVTHNSATITAIRDMEEHYDENLRIEQIAASVYLSRQQFAKVFLQTVGQTPRNYLRHIRIERAKSLLTATNLSMTVIADQTGLGESAYFTRVFHMSTGMTPSQFRRQARAATNEQKIEER